MSDKQQLCPNCNTKMEKRCYVSTETGEIVSRFWECPKCNLKL